MDLDSYNPEAKSLEVQNAAVYAPETTTIQKQNTGIFSWKNNSIYRTKPL